MAVNFLGAVVILHLAYLSNAKPAVKNDAKELIFSKDFINTSSTVLIRSGQHDLLNIFVRPDIGNEEMCVFFVEADVDNEKIRTFGLYVMKDENTTLKIRNDARDGVLATDNTNLMLVGTKDGIYQCDCNQCKPERYGSFSDSVMGIVMENGTGVIYVLNENKKVFKITEHGKKVSIDNRIKNAKQIMMDRYNNLYYYDTDKNVYMINDKGTKKIEGIPANPSYIKFLKPPREEVFMPIVVDDQFYAIFPNGTVSPVDIEIPKNMVFNMESSEVWVLGYQKIIYVSSPMILILENVSKKLEKLEINV